MTATTLPRGQKVAAEISALLRARNPLIWIVTREEARVEGYIAEAAKATKYETYTWDIAQGVMQLDGKNKDKRFQDPDPASTLNMVRTLADKEGTARTVWIMRDLPVWLNGPGAAPTLRTLRNLVRHLPGVPREQAQAIIILSPNGDVPPELTNHVTVIEWPLPDRSEIALILDAAIAPLPEFEMGKDGKPDTSKPFRALAVTKESYEAAIDAAVGLSGEEAAACYALSLITSRKIDPSLINGEKKRVIARDRVIEWFDPLPDGLDAVGGLENLKAWLLKRKQAYTPEAREDNVPMPLGVFIVGITGCGKSLMAKATATAYGVPLLRVDLGALKGKFVGESEGNLRKVFRLIEAIGRCVVWFDEIEKSLQGATSGSADGGVASDQLGAILTWMQERKNQAFIIMTANDVSALPPEFIRKGRFDEMFFVDLPNPEERVAVLKAALRAHGRQAIKINYKAVSDATDTLTGAEIAALVPDAIFTAFADKRRPITTEDLLAARVDIVPIAKTASAKIEALRTWAITEGRARPATKQVKVETGPAVRNLDF
jgi:AAA+ superfamily predicted ATPase